MNQDMAIQLIRYAMLIAGGFITQKGLLTEDQWVLITGFVLTMAAALWGIIVKWNTTSVPEATAARKDVPTVNPVTGKTIAGPDAVGKQS